MGEQFLAGFGRVKITPQEPVPMAGYGNTSRRFFKAIRDDIYTSCVAISYGQEQPVLLFHVDIISLAEETVVPIRQALTAKLGIPQDRVMLCCTHTHSAPDTANTKEESIQRYNASLPALFVEAAEQAMADRKPSRLYYGSTEAYHMNFVKHYKHVDADGQLKFFGDNFGKQVLDETTTHATDADPTLYIMKLERQDAKDIVMANWRTHCTLTGGGKRYDLSADLAGSFREQMEQKLGCLFAFYQGAAGNINPNSRMLEEEITRDCLSYGKVMTGYALQAMENMTEARPGPIRTVQRFLAGKVNHSLDYAIDELRRLQQIWFTTGNAQLVLSEGEALGIRSPYQVNAAIGRYYGEETETLELNALTLGPDVGIATVPNELFDSLSVLVEERSRFPVTLLFGYCSAYMGYIPSKFGYEYTCYESDCTIFAAGVGEDIVDNLVEMLDSLYQE